MAHNFEQSRPDHEIHHKHIPEGHAHLDEKHHKGMRSPIVGQFPTESGLESPEMEPGVGSGMGSVGGGSEY